MFLTTAFTESAAWMYNCDSSTVVRYGISAQFHSIFVCDAIRVVLPHRECSFLIFVRFFGCVFVRVFYCASVSLMWGSKPSFKYESTCSFSWNSTAERASEHCSISLSLRSHFQCVTLVVVCSFIFSFRVLLRANFKHNPTKCRQSDERKQWQKHHLLFVFVCLCSMRNGMAKVPLLFAKLFN